MSDKKSDKKYCYRYYESNTGNGGVELNLWKMAVVRETDKTFWYASEMMYMTEEQMIAFYEKHPKQVKYCRKNADRSKYHLTKEEAFKAFLYRKQYQISRIKLTLETVEACLSGLLNLGYIERNKNYSDAFTPVKTPGEDLVINDEPLAIASQYTWGGW